MRLLSCALLLCSALACAQQPGPTPPPPEPLSSDAKFQIFLRHTYSPSTFANAALSAGVSQAADSRSGYGQGFEGYAKRFGSSLADAETAVFFQKFALASLLRQDPRYFRAPERPAGERVGYALSRVVVTRNDDGSSGFNFSHVGGALISRSIANAYYPRDERTFGRTMRRWGTSLAVDAGLNVLREFWPDIKRKLRGK